MKKIIEKDNNSSESESFKTKVIYPKYLEEKEHYYYIDNNNKKQSSIEINGIKDNFF